MKAQRLPSTDFCPGLLRLIAITPLMARKHDGDQGIDETQVGRNASLLHFDCLAHYPCELFAATRFAGSETLHIVILRLVRERPKQAG
jgi:hypothetical protein